MFPGKDTLRWLVLILSGPLWILLVDFQLKTFRNADVKDEKQPVVSEGVASLMLILVVTGFVFVNMTSSLFTGDSSKADHQKRELIFTKLTYFICMNIHKRPNMKRRFCVCCLNIWHIKAFLASPPVFLVSN